MSKSKASAVKPAKKKQAKHIGEATVSLAHSFTDKEYREIGSQLNAALNELARLESELKAISGDYKARINGTESRRDELNIKLGNGYEMRSTKVRVRFDPKRGIKTYFAMEDTAMKKGLREDAMQPGDYQIELPAVQPSNVVPMTAVQPSNVVPMTDGAPLNPVAAAVGEAEADAEAVAKRRKADAIEVIRSESKASVSLIQRRLKIGYTSATAIVDELEREGVIGPANGSEPRAILNLPPAEPPTGTPAHDTANPPPPPEKKKSDKRKPTKAEFQAQQDNKGESDK